MELSRYQNLKIQILEIVDLSKDAIHIHIGFLVFMISIVVWKKGRIDKTCLIPVFGAALLMEGLDLWDDLSSLGYLRWSASLHDIINTTFWPVVIILLLSAKRSLFNIK